MNQQEMTPSLGGGQKGQVFTEQDFIVGPVQTNVTYGPLQSVEVKPEAMRDSWDQGTLSTFITMRDALPGVAESFSFDKPLRLEGQATYREGLTGEDKDRVSEFWLVHAGNELYVGCLMLNRLSDRRTACEQEDKGESDRPHSVIFREWMELLELEFAQLKRIQFFFAQYVNAVPHIHSEYFLDELLTLVDREEWKQGLRYLCREVQQSLSVH